MARPTHPDRRPAVVTGASSGIGAATALALARQGLPVALGARRVERCADLAAQIRDEGGEAVALPLDLADPDSIDRFAAAASDALGDIEVLISNAGVLRPGATVDSAPSRFAEEMQVNVLAVQHLLHRFAPGMIERGRGDLVFISSDTAVRARPFMSAYSTSKWGLEGLVGSLQQELEATGVRASVVRPGPTSSEMGSDWDADAGAVVINAWIRFGHARHPRVLPAEAIANAVTSIVTAPRGTHINLIEVSPEARVEDK